MDNYLFAQNIATFRREIIRGRNSAVCHIMEGFAKRIDYFIETGKIKIIEDSENSYARTICLV